MANIAALNPAKGGEQTSDAVVDQEPAIFHPIAAVRMERAGRRQNAPERLPVYGERQHRATQETRKNWGQRQHGQLVILGPIACQFATCELISRVILL